MNIYCPKHPKERLWVLKYGIKNPDKKLRQGMIVQTEWMLCKKCNKPYKPKVSFR